MEGTQKGRERKRIQTKPIQKIDRLATHNRNLLFCLLFEFICMCLSFSLPLTLTHSLTHLQLPPCAIMGMIFDDICGSRIYIPMWVHTYYMPPYRLNLKSFDCSLCIVLYSTVLWAYTYIWFGWIILACTLCAVQAFVNENEMREFDENAPSMCVLYQNQWKTGREIMSLKSLLKSIFARQLIFMKTRHHSQWFSENVCNMVYMLSSIHTHTV